MKEDDRLINAIIDLHKEMAGMRKDMNARFEKIEKQLTLNTKAIGELRLSVLKLAEQNKDIKEHDRRIRKIETALVRKKII